MANLGYVSTFNINGNELTLKDAALTEIVSEIIEAIGANNTNIAERINDLHNRSFDNTIKISSVSESEIASIQDGLYKIQYVTVTGEGDNATETLNNSAILIQDGTNQYLYKDGQLSSRTKTDSTWGRWITFEGGVTSVNGQTGAVSLSIPDDSNLVHKTGNETITGDKKFQINEENSININTNGITLFCGGARLNNWDWIAIDQKGTSEDETLQQALDERNNVQADWNQTTTTAADYIKNKPTIPTVPTTSTTVTENDTNPVSGGAVYAKLEDLIGSAPAALDTLGEIAAALNNDADLAGTLTNQIAGKISKVSPATAGNFASLNSDGTLSDSGHKHSDYLTSETQADWNETNTSSAAYINNKPTIKDELSSNYATSTDTNDDLLLASGDTYEEAFGKLEKAILDNSEVAATAIQEVASNMVTSVNGMTGVVTIDTGVTSFNGSTGAVTYTAPVTSVNGQTGDVTIDTGVTSFNGSTGAVTYTAPVTSVNGMTGAVTIPDAELSSNYAMSTATNEDLELASGDTYEEAFGKLEKAIIDNELVVTNAITDLDSRVTDTESLATVAKSGSYNDLTNRPTIPTKTSDLTNDSGFLTQAPVTSVNNQTGAVTLALGDTNVIETVKVNNTALTPDANKAVNITVPTKTSDLTNDSGFLTQAPVTSVNGQTGAVTVKANVQSDWNATTGDAAILNKPKIENVDTGNGTVFGTHINGARGEYISLMGDIKISNSNVDDYATIQLGYHGAGENDKIILTSRGSDGGVYVNTDQPFEYNNKEVATVDQIITPPVTSVNGMTGAVTITETQLSKGTATGTGNAVTDINVSNHQITLVKGATYATQEDINESISNLVNSAPATLDTLNELATALGNDPNFATTVATQIGEKYTKPSTGIPASDLEAGVIPTVPVQSVNGQTGAVTLALGDTNIIETIKVNNTALTPVSKVVNITVPTKVSDLTNDSNFTSNTGTITGITMNGVSKGTSGIVNLGTVLTEHQDISGKVDKVTGMGLSSNDYTTTEKNKLAGINIGSLDNLTTAELNSIFATS